MLKKNKYIYIACGGSGGHILPGLGVCSVLAELDNINIILVGVKRKENVIFFKKYIEDNSFKNVEYFFLPDFRLNKSFFFVPLNLVFYMVKLLYIIVLVYIKFLDKKPSLVFGFGSYASFPVVFSAAIFKICFTVIHEQNVKFGTANKLLIPWVNNITLNFSCKLDYLKTINRKFKFKIYNRIVSLISRNFNTKEKFQIIGNPRLVKNRIFDKDINISLINKSTINILVIGGSQGSDFLNNLVPNSLSFLSEELKNKINVIHIAGRGNVNRISEKYKKLKIKNEVLDISFNMNEIYRRSDLAISRAGAGVLSEIIFYQLPSILLPFKFVRGHQVSNAMFLKRLKAAIVLNENKCDYRKLVENIEELINNEVLYKDILNNLNKISYANTREEILRIAQKSIK